MCRFGVVKSGVVRYVSELPNNARLIVLQVVPKRLDSRRAQDQEWCPGPPNALRLCHVQFISLYLNMHPLNACGETVYLPEGERVYLG